MMEGHTITFCNPVLFTRTILQDVSVQPNLNLCDPLFVQIYVSQITATKCCGSSGLLLQMSLVERSVCLCMCVLSVGHRPRALQKWNDGMITWCGGDTSCCYHYLFLDAYNQHSLRLTDKNKPVRMTMSIGDRWKSTKASFLSIRYFPPRWNNARME